MTDVLAGGVDKPTPISAAYAKYITAVAVFGDPSFTHGQSFDVGTATTDGVSLVYLVFTMSPTRCDTRSVKWRLTTRSSHALPTAPV